VGVVYNELASQLRTEMREQLRIVRTFMEYATQQDAPIISGDLRRSIVMDDFNEAFDSFSATIRATAPQAQYTNEGTGEYIGAGRIYPTHAQALAFYWFKIGKFVVVASVAGQPGQHWWDGPDGTREEQRLTDACAAAFGS
jgi:hypothetical protein